MGWRAGKTAHQELDGHTLEIGWKGEEGRNLLTHQFIHSTLSFFISFARHAGDRDMHE